MPIVKCPSCQAKYDPGVDDELEGIPGSLSLKVVCPQCGQWLRLPEQEQIEPPSASPEILREMMSQSKLISDSGSGTSKAPTSRSRSRDDDDEDRPRSTRRRDEDDDDYDRPRRRSRRDEDDEDEEDDFYEDRGRYSDARDDYDDAPRSRRKGSKGDGFAITSMIIGIVSIVAALLGWCCCGYFGSGFSILLGVGAVIFGFIARSQGSKSGMGMAGLITGFSAIAIGIIMTILLIIGFAWLQANQGKFAPAPAPGAGQGGGGAPPPRVAPRGKGTANIPPRGGNSRNP